MGRDADSPANILPSPTQHNSDQEQTHIWRMHTGRTSSILFPHWLISSADAFRQLSGSAHVSSATFKPASNTNRRPAETAGRKVLAMKYVALSADFIV